MGLEKEPFRTYSIDKKKEDVFSVKLNAEEREVLNKCKRVIEQPKDSTCLKTLAAVGAKVILGDQTAFVLNTCFKNRRNNRRSGLSEIE